VNKETKQIGGFTTIESQTFIADVDTYLVVSETNNTDNLSVNTIYNERGKVTERRDKRGNITEHEYDDQGRRIRITELAGTADALTTTFTYWQESDRIASANRYNILESNSTYDSDLRLLTRTDVDLSTNQQRVWKYTYQRC